VSGRRKARHVRADLRQDDFRGAPIDTGDGVEQPDLSRERGEAALDLLREPVDGVLEVLDVREQLADEKRVVLAEAALERLAQLSRVPSTSAASIARPETPSTSEATELSLMPTS
jgi:hypothetical protein